MTTDTKVETLNKTLLIAVETNAMPLVHLAFSKGAIIPTNIQECLFMAIEKNQMDQVNFLTKKMVIPVVPLTKTRPVTYSSQTFNMTAQLISVGGNTQIFRDYIFDYPIAVSELDSGLISVEEIDKQNESGWNVLMYVALWYDEPRLKELLTTGLNPNLTNKYGQTALMIAVEEHCKQNGRYRQSIVETLLKDPKVDVNNVSGGYSALRYAVGTPSMMEILLNHPKIDVNVPHVNGFTILHLVCNNMGTNSLKILEMLLKHPNIDVNLKTVDAGTPLMILCSQINISGVHSMIEMLLKHPKIDVTIVNKSGKNALQICCPHHKTVELLIKATPVKN